MGAIRETSRRRWHLRGRQPAKQRSGKALRVEGTARARILLRVLQEPREQEGARSASWVPPSWEAQKKGLDLLQSALGSPWRVLSRSKC